MHATFIAHGAPSSSGIVLILYLNMNVRCYLVCGRLYILSSKMPYDLKFIVCRLKETGLWSPFRLLDASLTSLLRLKKCMQKNRNSLIQFWTILQLTDVLRSLPIREVQHYYNASAIRIHMSFPTYSVSLQALSTVLTSHVPMYLALPCHLGAVYIT